MEVRQFQYNISVSTNPHHRIFLEMRIPIMYGFGIPLYQHFTNFVIRILED